MSNEWGYRIPFAIQWFWPILLSPLVFLALESPWYLVRQNRLNDAEKSIRRLPRASAGIDPKKTLATIVYTNNLEEQLSVGTTYWDCFTGFELRRTEIEPVRSLAGNLFAVSASLMPVHISLSRCVSSSWSPGSLNDANSLLGGSEHRAVIRPWRGSQRPRTVWMFLQLVSLNAVSALPEKYTRLQLTRIDTWVVEQSTYGACSSWLSSSASSVYLMSGQLTLPSPGDTPS